ncbi:HTH domain-containing protein [Nisaea sediminum]|uniref:HTH domain-containing protein n=1 Tax=Nisaea sediminum TaxID=2775867 RepID=UPI001867C329|nr:hypothetical protein [Nisaea sediminum]
MAGYKATEIRKPSNDKEFEENCVVLFREILSDPHVKTVGTSGQGQDGVDVVGNRFSDPEHIVGIQCKLKTGKSRLHESEVKEEVKKALKYTPPLREYIIVATSKDDTKLDQLAQRLAIEQERAGRSLRITVWGWDTLCQKINQHDAAKEAFDPGHSPAIAANTKRLEAIEANQAKAATSSQIDQLSRKLDSQLPPMAGVLSEEYANKTAQRELRDILIKRGFVGSDTGSELAKLAERVISGDLALTSDRLRAEISDRAVRANWTDTPIEQLKFWLESSARLDPNRDLTIARALLKAAEGSSDEALRALRSRLDPDSRAALMGVLDQTHGQGHGLNWVLDQELSSSDLSPMGIHNVLVQLSLNERFDAAIEFINDVPEPYFEEAPVLLLIRSELRLASILPRDRRRIIFKGLPIALSRIGFEPGPRGQTTLKEALGDLYRLERFLDGFSIDVIPQYVENLILWISLENEETRDAALDRLKAELSDPNRTYSRVGFALSYGVPFDQDALMRSLSAQKSVGGWTEDQTTAVIAIAVHAENAEKICNLFDLHGEEILKSEAIGKSLIWRLRIEALARCSRFGEAYELLKNEASKVFDPSDASEILDLIESIENKDEIGRLRHRYEKEKNTTDLRLLIEQLKLNGEKSDLAHFTLILANETNGYDDFSTALKCLYDDERFEDAILLCDKFDAFIQNSIELRLIKGWALCRLGRVMEAREISRSIPLDAGSGSARELAIMTAVESGDWGDLQRILAHEAARSNELPINDLIRLSLFAHELDSHYVNHFRDAALTREPENPEVNLSAYRLAIVRGTEAETDWLEKAIQTSGPDGPVQRVSIKEMLERLPQWNDRSRNIEEKLQRAEIPCFIAASAVNRQILDRTLGQAIRNLERDQSLVPYPVFAAAGHGRMCDLSNIDTVAFDISALISLHHLGLLERALKSVQTPLIAPSTLHLLLLERQRLNDYQRSQVKKAERLLSLVNNRELKEMQLSSTPSIAQAAEISDDLAAMIAAADQDGGLVVTRAPIPKRGSLLEECVDVSVFPSVLTDTHSVLTFLRSKGAIEEKIDEAATHYLSNVDVGWPSPLAISDKQNIYLDDIAVTYLDFVGILHPLTRFVKAVYIHPDIVRLARDTIKYQAQTSQLVKAIDEIREIIQRLLDSRKLNFTSRRLSSGEDSDGDLAEASPTPTMDLLSDVSGADAVVVDDRYLNHSPTWTDRKGHTCNTSNVFDVIDLVFTGKPSGAPDQKARWQSRQNLRKAGFYAAPLETDELLAKILAAPIAEGQLVETLELRAIRDSILLPLMTPCFAPIDRPWFDNVRMAVVQALRSVWTEPHDLDHAIARSDWMFDLLPVPTEWIHDPTNADHWRVAEAQTAGQLGAITVSINLQGERRAAFHQWVSQRITSSLRRYRGHIWNTLLEFTKNMIEQHSNDLAKDIEQSSTQMAALFLLDSIPIEMREELLSDSALCKRLNIDTTTFVNLSSGIKITQNELFRAAQNAVDNKKTAKINLSNGKTIHAQVRCRDGRTAEIKIKGIWFTLDDVAPASRKAIIRQTAIGRLLAEFPLSELDENFWRDAGQKGALTSDLFFKFKQSVSSTPEALHRFIQSTTTFSSENLVPENLSYCSALLALPTDGASFEDYIVGPLRLERESLIKRHPQVALRRIAFSSIADALVPHDLLDGYGFDDISDLLDADDPFSLIFGFQICAARLEIDPRYEELGSKFLHKAIADEAALTRCQIASGVSILAMQHLAENPEHSGFPVFWRRLLALTHAGLVTDAMNGIKDGSGFFDWVIQGNAFEYVWLSLLDRQSAPRWKSDWILPEQLYAETIGRAVNAFGRLPQDQQPAEWKSILTSAVKASEGKPKSGYHFFPGPLDEFIEHPTEKLPDEMLQSIKDGMASAQPINDVPGLMHIAYTSKPPADLLSCIVERVKGNRDKPLGENDFELWLLEIFAHISGTTKSEELASAVMERCFDEATSFEPRTNATGLFAIILSACAGFSDIDEYRTQLGTAARRLALICKPGEELSDLNAVFRVLRKLSKELDPYLAPARAVSNCKK